MTRLSVIILSYNTDKTTERCINSLIACTNIELEIIVVDNGSSDGSLKMLEFFKKKLNRTGGEISFKLIVNHQNLGYPKGNNQGIKNAKGKYILFLNSDTIVKKINFKQLLNYLDSREDVGVLTVNVVLPSGKIDPASHRGFPTIWNSFCYFLKLEAVFKKIPIFNHLFGGYHLVNKDLRSIHEIDSPTGAFYLTRKSLLDRIGGFDENFFMYGEDLDLSYRVKKQGYKVLYYPLYKVVHLKYASGLGHIDFETRKQIKGHFFNAMKLFYKKHYQDRYPNYLNKLIYFLIDFKKKFS